jgi:hypothetical protein
MNCKKCGLEIPSKTSIDGKTVYLHSRRLCLECSPYKQDQSSYHAWKASLKTTHHCSDCKKDIPIEGFYLRKSTGRGDRPQSRCKRCEAISSQARSSSFKAWAVDYKGGECKMCGYDSCLDALQFHHRDPNQKDVIPARMKLWNKGRAIEELDKCDLVCANCHAEIHSEWRSPK